MDIFERQSLIIGEEETERLGTKKVALFGVGGVGSYAAEALARCGVGCIELIDSDAVSVSNTNRQLCALTSTVGRLKTEVTSERLRDINPKIKVIERAEFFLPENADSFDFSSYDFVIDAIDTVSAKLHLIESAKKVGTPIISSMGAGGKLDPTKFKVADIYKTSVCPLARVMRTELKRRGIKKLKVVYSEEQPIKAIVREGEELPSGRNVPASIATVPSVAGLIIASEVISDLTKADNN